MHRFYVEEDHLLQQIATLTPEDARHALRVLRMEKGAAAEILCGGTRYLARMLESQGTEVHFQLEEALPTTEPALQITLFQGLSKADRMEWTVQKAVEVGVHAIVPVRMARCVVKLDDREAEKKAGTMAANCAGSRKAIRTMLSPFSFPAPLPAGGASGSPSAGCLRSSLGGSQCARPGRLHRSASGNSQPGDPDRAGGRHRTRRNRFPDRRF